VFFPSTFLCTEATVSPWVGALLPSRRPMDNLDRNSHGPGEDEWATCTTTSLSPYMSLLFPDRREHYGRYLTFREATLGEVACWKEALIYFLKKLTWKYQRPLLLKSPTHTCRIGRLLEMFPEARFVHIHRNPFAVFQSTQNGELAVGPYLYLQRPSLESLEEVILERYREMYGAFFAERDLIPAGRFHELGYEDLEKDPLGQVQAIYENLGLPDFQVVREPLQRRIESLAHYRKNHHPELPASLRQRIVQTWRRCFDEWGYPLEPSGNGEVAFQPWSSCTIPGETPQ